MEFSQLKKLNLQKIDLSRKGHIDEKIIELVNIINEHEDYVTTSSCSGRTIVFTNSELKKKGCNWLFVSHDIVSEQNVIEALAAHSGSAILKFEPFVMHVRCSSIKSAQILHTCCLESGFRNSGMTVNRKGGVVLAVRSTLSLEAPLSCDGKLLVPPEYIFYLVKMCNEKMEENWNRTERLVSQLQNAFGHTEEPVLKQVEKSHQKYSSKNNEVKDKSEDFTDTLGTFCDSFEILSTGPHNLGS